MIRNAPPALRAGQTEVSARMAKLVIVESPAKAKTIGKYLGKDYEVTASMGHIRTCHLQLGIDVEHGYTPNTSTSRGRKNSSRS